METFLGRIAQIINQSGIPEHEMCVVFPNRRAGLFLKRELIPADKPRWMPTMLSIEDFVYEVSQLLEPDNTQLLALLFKAYSEVSAEATSFDSFLGYGAEILRDFEEVDQYMADPKNLFDYVKQAREIDIWKPGEEMTDFEKNYLNFYNSLDDQYFALKDICLGRHIAWQGLASRIIAENPSVHLDNLPWKKVIFAGFNALTPAQLAIMKYLVARNKAEIVFDADEYYLEDPVAEAGLFLRKYRSDKELGTFREITSHFLTEGRKIYTCGIPGKTGQARIAGSILQNIPPEEHHLTAVVLADESMLLPVLNSLPPHLSSFNVTMGFPISQAPLYALIDSIFRLHVNSTPAGSAKPAFYHADVTAVLSNNYLHRIIDYDKATIIVEKIRKNNYSYIALDEICRLAETEENDLLNTLFSGCTKTRELLTKVAKIMVLFKEEIVGTSEESTRNHKPEDSYLIEVLYSLYKIIADLIECFDREEIEIGTLSTLHSFFRQTASSGRVPFYGEPLQGIQIMGMLETRVLDFKNVILVSVNEDILPSAKSNRSFIPFDIRVHYGLPTHQERQAIFAYHFYHLLQRCTNAWLIYDENDDTFGGGEKSRYISQLEWELPKRGIQTIPLKSFEATNVNQIPQIEIQKDQHAINKLLEKGSKGFSFTSLKMYINCPLSFYYAYVLGLQELEEVEEDISLKTMGIILHEILEDLYRPFMDTFPDEATLKESLINAEHLIAVKTAKIFPALKFTTGRNLLFMKVAETWLRRFLKSELNSINEQTAPVIKGVELPLKRPVTIEVAGKGLVDVIVYGKIDRLDLRNGILRVIDYKTGKVDDKDVKEVNLDDLLNHDKKTEKQLQLLLYRYLVEGDEISAGYQIQPGIISFKALAKGFMPLESTIQTSDFESSLKILFEEIFNSEIPFTQTEPKHCNYCNFKQICHRN